MIEGVDYSWGRPGGTALAANGKAFAMRYVAYPGEGGKAIDATELRDLHGHGIAVAFVFESTSNRAAAGRPAGVTDAGYAKTALNALGVPSDRPVYFAVDWGANASQQPFIDAYLGGAASVLGVARVGVYGSYDVVTRCHGSGSARWFWQTLAWSYGKFASFAHLYQYQNGATLNGASVDLDRAYQPDFGGWLPAPPDSSTGGDMGVKVKLAATVNTSAPWSSFATARTRVACKSNALATGMQVDFAAGVDLGVVEKATLIQPLGPWPINTAVVLTNVNGETHAFIAAEVTVTPIVPPVAPSQTVTITGQGLRVTGP